MLKRTITYTDYNGKQRTEDYWFHMTAAELTEMDLRQKKGLQDYLNDIVEADDRDKLIGFFKDLILMSVGVKSDDGKYFRKSETISDDFKSTEAYSTLWMELISNTEKAIQFVNGIMPQDVVNEMERQRVAQAKPELTVVEVDPE